MAYPSGYATYHNYRYTADKRKQVKHLGIILITSWLVLHLITNPIVSNHLEIIEDYVEDEKKIGKQYLNQVLSIRNQIELSEETRTILKNTYEEIIESDPYNESIKLRINEIDGNRELKNYIPNISQFNDAILNETFYKVASNKKQPEIIITALENKTKDSVDISFNVLPILKHNERIKYYLKNYEISLSQLKSYDGNLNELEARIYNPVTDRSKIIKSR